MWANAPGCKLLNKSTGAKTLLNQCRAGICEALRCVQHLAPRSCGATLYPAVTPRQRLEVARAKQLVPVTWLPKTTRVPALGDTLVPPAGGGGGGDVAVQGRPRREAGRGSPAGGSGPGRTCGEVQRAGLPARRVAAVHVVGPHQALDALHVPVAAGLEQLPRRLRAPATRRLSQRRPARAPPPRHARPGPGAAARKPPSGRHGHCLPAAPGGREGPARRRTDSAAEVGENERETNVRAAHALSRRAPLGGFGLCPAGPRALSGAPCRVWVAPRVPLPVPGTPGRPRPGSSWGRGRRRPRSWWISVPVPAAHGHHERGL